MTSVNAPRLRVARAELRHHKKRLAGYEKNLPLVQSTTYR